MDCFPETSCWDLITNEWKNKSSFNNYLTVVPTVPLVRTAQRNRRPCAAPLTEPGVCVCVCGQPGVYVAAFDQVDTCGWRSWCHMLQHDLLFSVHLSVCLSSLSLSVLLSPWDSIKAFKFCCCFQTSGCFTFTHSSALMRWNAVEDPFLAFQNHL